MNDKKILFFGTPAFAAEVLKTLIEEKYDVCACVSQPDRPVGRKHHIQPTPVHEVCIENNIPCLQPEKLSSVKEEIAALQPDILLTCAYGQFVPSSILAIPSMGALNIHPSLLPKYRGGAPIQRAVMNGDSETGVCLMEMVKKMDAGQVFACVRTPIGPDETFADVNQRLIQISCDLVKNALPLYINGKLEGTVQDETKVVLAPNIAPEEEKVCFHKENITHLYNHIRGLYDWPVAYGELEGRRVKFFQVRKEEKDVKQEPGTILGFQDHAMLIACMGGLLKVYELQKEGKKRMKADDFHNGEGRNDIGKVFF